MKTETTTSASPPSLNVTPWKPVFRRGVGVGVAIACPFGFLGGPSSGTRFLSAFFDLSIFV